MISLKVSHWLSKFWYDSHQIGVLRHGVPSRHTNHRIFLFMASMMLGPPLWSCCRRRWNFLRLEGLRFSAQASATFSWGVEGVSCSGSPPQKKIRVLNFPMVTVSNQHSLRISIQTNIAKAENDCFTVQLNEYHQVQDETISNCSLCFTVQVDGQTFLKGLLSKGVYI